ETTPLATFSRLKSYQDKLTDDEKLQERSRQGILVPGLEMKIVGENGEVEWNGEEMGELLLRGPWIADEDYKEDRSEGAFDDGGLQTGEVVPVDQDGSIQVIDRTDDHIKSGCACIPSVALDTALMAPEAAFEASVAATPDPEWQERPVACVVLHKDGVGK